MLAAFHTAQDAGAAAGAFAGGALAALGTGVALGVGVALVVLTIPAWALARRAQARVTVAA